MKAAVLWIVLVGCAVAAAATEGTWLFWVFLAVMVLTAASAVTDEDRRPGERPVPRVASVAVSLLLAFAVMSAATERPTTWWLSALLVVALIAVVTRVLPARSSRS